jgi:hypothetical protein
MNPLSPINGPKKEKSSRGYKHLVPNGTKVPFQVVDRRESAHANLA